jgi:hypothetical protein
VIPWLARAAGLVGMASIAAGCATILVGPKQSVTISSTPAGARALVLPENIEVVTPADVNLSRKRSHTVRCELPGYRTTSEYIDPLPGGAAYGNIVLGGIIGMLIDINSGAAFSLRPDPVEIVLEPEAPAPLAAGPGSR